MDKDLLKQKLAELKSRSSRKNILWKPEEGKQTIRIIPSLFNPDWCFTELYFHYNIATKTVLSPKTNGRPDPIDEFADELMSSGNDADYKTGVKLKSKLRTYAPIIVRGEEDEGVKYWGFGATIFEDLLRKMDDPDWGDITDPHNGRDIVITYEKPAKGFPETHVDVKPVQTPISKDDSVLEKIEKMQDIRKIWKEPTYDELKQLLVMFLDTGEKVDMKQITNNSDDASDNEQSANTEMAAASKGSLTAEKSKASASDSNAEDRFAKLFGKKA